MDDSDILQDLDRPNHYEINKRASKLTVLVMGVLAIVSWHVYKMITAPPPLPDIDLEEWWGQYPINMDPDQSIRPYTIEFPEVIVDDLKERLLHCRPFTPPLENSGFKYGFNSGFLTRVLEFWRNSYNFKEREQFLNKYNHYITNIQGLDIHYMHVKPKAPENVEVVPILMVHSWPSSIREFYEIIPLLTTYQDDKHFVFEVIAPSLPGFGFSEAPTRPGMGPIGMSVILHNLMNRIGYQRYYVQGGDLGHTIGSVMATVFPDNVLGLHANMPTIKQNPTVIINTVFGSIWPSFVVEPEVTNRMYPLEKHALILFQESGYIHMHATKPDTIGIALSESPAGLAAYILEKFSSWTNLENREASDGGLLNKFSLIHLLDNVMIYWVTNTITTSMRVYVDYFPEMSVIDRIPTKVLAWGIKFKHEIHFTPDSLLKMKYHNYLRSTIVEDGGHFPSMEHPQILSNDMYSAVTVFRMYKGIRVSHVNKDQSEEPAPKKTIYDFTAKDINGNEISFEKYKGKVLIIVNVASQCGYTNTHYAQLNELYDKHEEKGLRILAFPCNQFGGQEPGTLNEIFDFTQKKKVKFDIFEKVEVNGENAHPIWAFLKQEKGGTLGDFIKWNFSKFIVDRNGVPVERFGPNVSPMDLEPYLAKHW